MITAEELALTSGGDEGRFSPYCVYLPGGDPGAIEAVRDGFAGVQDEGSQLVARAVTVADVGEDTGRWLDMCRSGRQGRADRRDRRHRRRPPHALRYPTTAPS